MVSFSKPDIYPRLVVLVIPYLVTIQSLATFLNNESEQERNARIATLQAVDSEYRSEKSRSRATAFIPIGICVAVGGIFGWLFPLEPEANVLTSILYLAVGIPIGMAVHRYLPAQRKLRSLESTKERLRW